MQNQPNRGQHGAQGGAQQPSPAFIMASRIKNEQGSARAAEYLAAMAPYLAPGERAHIAAQLNLPQYTPPPPPPQQAPPQPQQSAGGMGDPMQMMQMLSALGGMGNAGGAAGMGNPMMLAQMLGGLMGNPAGKKH